MTVENVRDGIWETQNPGSLGAKAEKGLKRLGARVGFW
jgi:hypothetical protein